MVIPTATSSPSCFFVDVPVTAGRDSSDIGSLTGGHKTSVSLMHILIVHFLQNSSGNLT